MVDDAPLLFHTGPRSMFPWVREAVAHVLGDVSRLRYVGFSHIESDECGSMNEFLAVAPRAEVLCSRVAAMTSADLADRPPRALADGEEISLGKKRVRWLDAPHLPHNWECGYLFESSTRTLLCGDLLTHGGSALPAITESDLIGPAVATWKAMPESVAVVGNTRQLLEKLAATEPTTLAVMHGSVFRGDGHGQLRNLAAALGV